MKLPDDDVVVYCVVVDSVHTSKCRFETSNVGSSESTLILIHATPSLLGYAGMTTDPVLLEVVL